MHAPASRDRERDALSADPAQARADRVQARLERPLFLAALLSIPALILDASHIDELWRTVGIALNWAVWVAFLAEVVVMLRVVPNRRAWLKAHPLDLAILVFTPPFLPASLQAARVFRLLRLLRLIRLAALGRRLLTTEGVRDAGVLAVLTVLGGGAAYTAVEKGQHLSNWDGVWWAITTVTTVGYGDEYPRTTGGRLIAIVVMVVGIGFVAILTAAAAERLVRARQGVEEEQRRAERLLDEIVIRLDRMEQARSVARDGAGDPEANRP